MRRWMATTTVWTMGAVTNRPHTVARSPTTVVSTVGFIVIQPDAYAAVIAVSATSYDTARRQDHEQPDRDGGR